MTPGFRGSSSFTLKTIFIRSEPMSAILVKMPPAMRSAEAPSDSPMAKPRKQPPTIERSTNKRMMTIMISSSEMRNRPTDMPERSGMLTTSHGSPLREPWDVVNIPLRSGMSVGLFLISLELIMMVIILLFVDRSIVGGCFLGFAIGESLGASALRIAGGIFTKIADIGSDLMKIVFNVKEDDPRNPGVIADCTGDNAGDSVGPTADGFETYGVTGVALITFITLAVTAAAGVHNYLDIQAKLIVWIFAMRFLMDFMSGISYFINQAISEKQYKGLKEFNFEEPLTRLIWIAAILCISTSFLMSALLIRDLTVPGIDPDHTKHLWWQLATIISCGTLAAVLIPEFTKIFTSS